MRQSKIIIGLGYGDEGKGMVTAHLAKKAKKPLVIRFSGGHQAGHTVVDEHGQRHVFSSFGSGTLDGFPTYWSQYCTFDPVVFWNEGRALKLKGLTPVFYLDALAPVTTPYDTFFNRSSEKKNQHGSCGMGIGATYERMEGPNKLYAQDLAFSDVLKWKLNAIRTYYQSKLGVLPDDWQEKEDLFIKAVELVLPQVKIVKEAAFFKEIDAKSFIFEGSQGILLDMNHGFFPNVTRSNTTSKQALALIERNQLPDPEIYYITRAYQTRHGKGPLSNEALEPHLKPTPLETNQYNEWQGHQRRSLLDIDMINYALQCDQNYSDTHSKHLVVTCLDQLRGRMAVTYQQKVIDLNAVQDILPFIQIHFDKILESWSDNSDDPLM